jgi:hypothetical protein
VHKHVLATFIRRNESVALGIVEPFNSTRGHLIYLYTHLLELKNTPGTFARQQVSSVHRYSLRPWHSLWVTLV